MKISEIVAGIKPYVLGWIRDYASVGQVNASNVPRLIRLQAPLTSTSWDGDAYSTVAKTALDLSSVFGVPAGVKMILADVTIRDSGSSGTDCAFCLSPNSTDWSGILWRCSGQANDSWSCGAFPIPCDANGDVYYQVLASGSGTLDVYLRIWGYWV
jgi:hypothetical protein